MRYSKRLKGLTGKENENNEFRDLIHLYVYCEK